MNLTRIIIISALFAGMSTTAQAFSLQFDWGDISRCTTGSPNTVKNPIFTLKDVPEGTKKLRFKLRDLNVRSYNHGGGTVAYTGASKITPGAFTYKSPCPPNGRHNYQWSATALDANNKSIGTAKAKKRYP